MSTDASVVRRPAVAGSFYPATPEALRAEVRAHLDAAPAAPTHAPVPRAIVVPHAGYVYSGPVAATAYRRIEPARDQVRRVVLLGPAHRVAVRGLALSSADAWATPLGLVPLDTGALDLAAEMACVSIDDVAHAPEHSLEVQLPFLQTVLDDFRLVPFVVGAASIDEVAAVLDAVWDAPDTLVVVSTDLSHYLTYDDAVRIDTRTAAAITAAEANAVADDGACGARPLRGLLHATRRRGLRVEQLDLRNSGDTAGDRNRVVGYGSFAVA